MSYDFLNARSLLITIRHLKKKHPVNSSCLNENPQYPWISGLDTRPILEADRWAGLWQSASFPPATRLSPWYLKIVGSSHHEGPLQTE